MTAHDVLKKIEKIDEEIIQLLADRIVLCQEAHEDDPEALGGEYQSEILALWDTAADERGWVTGPTMKICRGVLDLCKPEE